MSNISPALDDRDQFEIQFHEKNYIAAIETAGRIINDLIKKIKDNNSNKKLLIIYLIKRIKLNFDARNFQGVVDDCLLLESMGKNIYKETDVFLMKEQALMEQYIEETNRRFKQAQIEYRPCRCLSNDPNCWPSSSAWATFNASVDGRLLLPRSSAASCTASYFDNSTCTDARTHWSDSLWRSNHVGAMQYFNWENSSCSIFNLHSTCTQGSIPVIAVNAIWPEHVQKTIQFAATNNLRLVIKTTGHDLLGRSTAFGSLLLWLHDMKNMTFIPQYSSCNAGSVMNVVRLTAGVQWGDVYTWLDGYNLTVLGGTSKSVAAAGGYIQGGGHSPLSRWAGMPTDQVLEYDVVTANGERLMVSPCQNNDLFWALSGGGAGTYAVVISVVLKTFPTPYIVGALQNIRAPNETRYAQLIRDFFRLLPSLADAGWSGYFVMKDMEIDITLLWPNGNLTAANLILNTFATNNLDLQYANNIIGSLPSMYQLYINVLYGRDPTGYNGILGSRLLPENLVRSKIDDVAQTFVRMKGQSSSLSALTISMVSGGAAARTNGVNNSVNPAWRTTMLHVFYGQAWFDQASTEYQNTVATQVNQRVKLLDELANGTFLNCYMNEADPNEPDWKLRFFGSQELYDRLKIVKQKYDPSGLFVCPKCVGSDDWTTDLNCPRSSQSSMLSMTILLIFMGVFLQL